MFCHFQYLKFIDFKLHSFRSFFHYSAIKWMPYLNSHKLFSGDRMPLIVRFNDFQEYSNFIETYGYPNEDICLFKYYPQNQDVFPFIAPGKHLPCTCTLKWLQQNIHSYPDYFNVTNDYEFSFNLN